jgi:hypothetical protein
MDSQMEVLKTRMPLTCLGSEQIDSLDIMGQHEFDRLAQLFRQRRSLPVYREGIWFCYDCSYYTTDIDEISSHILRFHDPLPPDPEELFGTH